MVVSVLWGAEALRRSKYDLRRAIRVAYRDKLESNYHSSDPRDMWCGLRAITDYKGRNSSDAQPIASHPDELNTFYARFELSNTIPTVRLAEYQDNCTLSLTTAYARRALQRINPQKSPGLDGIPGCVLRGSTDQLAEVFTSIFNFSLYQSAVPTCSKQTNIVPVPKKPSITCLNDYHPVALNPSS